MSIVSDDDVFAHSVCPHVAVKSNSRAPLSRYSWHSCSLSPLSGIDQASSSLLLEADKGLTCEGAPIWIILSTMFKLLGRDA